MGNCEKWETVTETLRPLGEFDLVMCLLIITSCSLFTLHAALKCIYLQNNSTKIQSGIFPTQQRGMQYRGLVVTLTLVSKPYQVCQILNGVLAQLLTLGHKLTKLAPAV